MKSNLKQRVVGVIVVRAGWTPIDAGCVPRPGDRVVELDR